MWTCVRRIAEEAALTPPEMVFGKNQLLFFHAPSGVSCAFLAVEALKGAHFGAGGRAADASTAAQQQQLKVAIAKHNTNKCVHDRVVATDRRE